MHNNMNVNVSGPQQPSSQYKTVVLKGQVPFATQVTEPNIKYVIKHNFVLNGDVTIPENCILEFDGGSISGEHTITGQNTDIEAGLVKIFGLDVIFEGTWKEGAIYPQWWGAIGDGLNDDTLAIQTAINKLQHIVVANHSQKDIKTIIFPAGKYKITSTIYQSIMVRIKTDGFVLFNSYVTNGSCWFVKGFDDDWLGFDDGFVPEGSSVDGSRGYFSGDLINGQQGLIIQNCTDVTTNTGVEIGENTNEHLHPICKYRINCVKITGFGVGLKLNSFDNYIISIERSIIDWNNCNIQLGNDSKITNNSGENIVFSKCTISNSQIGFQFNVPSMDIHLENCSLDGLVIGFLDNTEDDVILSSCLDIYGGNIEAIGEKYVNNGVPSANSGLTVGDFSGTPVIISCATIVLRGDYYRKLFNNNNAQIVLNGCVFSSSIVNNSINAAEFSEKEITCNNCRIKKNYSLIGKGNNLILDGDFNSITSIPTLDDANFTAVGHLFMKYRNWQKTATIEVVTESVGQLNTKCIKFTPVNSSSQGLVIKTAKIPVQQFKYYRAALILYSTTSIVYGGSYEFFDINGNSLSSGNFTEKSVGANSQNRWLWEPLESFTNIPKNAVSVEITYYLGGNIGNSVYFKAGMIYLEQL